MPVRTYQQFLADLVAEKKQGNPLLHSKICNCWECRGDPPPPPVPKADYEADD